MEEDKAVIGAFGKPIPPSGPVALLGAFDKPIPLTEEALSVHLETTPQWHENLKEVCRCQQYHLIAPLLSARLD